MPRILDPDMETHAIAGSTFQFSAVKPSNLGANEYCLATIVIDGSGSTESFWPGIRSAVLESVRALRGTKTRPNPRADNTLLRVVVFDHVLHEIHGFRMLTECNDDDYQNLRCPAGTTALYDATYTSIQATLEESKVLEKNSFQSNGIVIVITDGAEYPANASTATRNMIAKSVQDARASEILESLVTILVGVNASGPTGTYLDEFQREAGFQQYVQLNDANPDTLGRLGGFVSRSISSQSQALGTGGPSQSLTF